MFQSIVSKFLLKNEKTQAISYSLTMTVIAFIIINLKLLFAGVDICHFIHMSEFSGVDYAASLAALSALHVGNKVANNQGGKDVEEA